MVAGNTTPIIHTRQHILWYVVKVVDKAVFDITFPILYSDNMIQ